MDNMNIKLRKLLLLIGVILVSALLADNSYAQAANQKKYGVIIDIAKKIEVYDNLVVKSPNNNLMVKAKELSKKLGFSYSYNSETKKLTIKKDKNNKLIFTLGSKDFLYQKGNKTYKATATYPFYYDSKSKSYLIHYNTLKYLINTKYFSLSGEDYFSKKGYKGMIYLSDRSVSVISDAEYDEMLDDIIKTAVTNNMSDFEKVLAINNYMVDNFKYDYSYRNYYAEDMLRDGKGVCQAYTELFQILMDRLNIECLTVTGTASDGRKIAGHTWNIVKLDGYYYHIDVTWNDDDDEYPVSRSYLYFLVSDKQMSDFWHYWDSNDYPKCKKGADRNNNTIAYIVDKYFISYKVATFDNADNIVFYKVKYDGTGEKQILSCKLNTNTFSYSFDGNWLYYLHGNETLSLNRVNLISGKTENEIISADLFSDCGRSIAAENNWVYFNNENSVYRINVKTLKRQEIFHSDIYISEIQKSIKGIQVICYSNNKRCIYEIDFDGNILKKS